MTVEKYKLYAMNVVDVEWRLSASLKMHENETLERKTNEFHHIIQKP